MDDSFCIIGRIYAGMAEYLLKNMGQEAKGLMISHGSILFMLFGGREATMQEIAWEIDKTPQTVTVLVNKLVQNGFVCKRKNENDNRSYLIRLTEKGEGFKPVFDIVSKQLYERQYRNFTEEEKQTLRFLLTKMERNFDRQ